MGAFYNRALHCIVCGTFLKAEICFPVSYYTGTAAAAVLDFPVNMKTRNFPRCISFVQLYSSVTTLH